MHLNFSTADIFSVAIVSMLFTLLVYHFFIYYGRNGEDRIYYIYFSLFALNFAIYLACVTGLQKFIFTTAEIRHAISPAITGITYFLLLDYARKMFTIILNFPKSKHKIFRPYFYSFIIYGLLVSTYPFFEYNFYIRKIFPMVVVFATFSPVYMFVIFTNHILKQNAKDFAHKIILTGFFIFMLDFALEEILSVLNIYYPLKGSYFISGLSALLWAFALAIRFNNEYKELQTLKLSLETKVVERTTALEQAIEQRTNTFVNLAHEVRTPLTLVSNYVDEQIKNHGKTSEIWIIKENTEKLVRDISNFFTEEKFRKGTINFDHSQIINLSEFISSKAEMFANYTQKKDQDLESDIESGIYVKADPIALGSLVNNLVENSIKYTPEGGRILIKLKVFEEKIELAIHDNGVGIPEESQVRIFEPYYQVTEKKQNSQGIGMGLSIVNNIIKSLGGKITLKSSVGKGTNFIIELTRYRLAKNEFAQTCEHNQPIMVSHIHITDIIDPEKKHSVLVVEDNLQLLHYLAEKMKEHFTVFTAANGKMALEKLKTIPKPNLIISDIMMDYLDGYEFLEALVKNGFNAVPVIFLTAKSTDNDKIRGLKMGAVDYICKPFKINELIIKAVSIVNNSEQQKNELVNTVSKVLNKMVEVTGNEVKESGFDYNCYVLNITDREKEIINCLKEGFTYKQIAEKLFIAENTVAKHIQNIYEKTGAKNRMELVGRMNR
jgi:signal transduction histidine kinase/DNA-binding NarL/FixJ family response regulator